MDTAEGRPISPELLCRLGNDRFQILVQRISDLTRRAPLDDPTSHYLSQYGGPESSYGSRYTDPRGSTPTTRSP
jgi:hypothetical protein